MDVSSQSAYVLGRIRNRTWSDDRKIFGLDSACGFYAHGEIQTPDLDPIKPRLPIGSVAETAPSRAADVQKYFCWRTPEDCQCAANDKVCSFLVAKPHQKRDH